MEHNPNAQSEERVRKYGEVFTPEWLASDMCDKLEAQDNPDAFEPETTFLEPSCGEGVFVVEILRRKFARCKKRSDYTTALRSVYAMELLADNVETAIKNVESLCREHFKPTKKELEIISDHIIQADSLKVLRMINAENLNNRDGREWLDAVTRMEESK